MSELNRISSNLITFRRYMYQ